MMGTRQVAEATERMRNLADEAEAAADRERLSAHFERRECQLADAVISLAAAVRETAVMLEHQHRFLMDLRNHKADG